MHTPNCQALCVSLFSLATVPTPIPIYHCPDWPEIERHCNVEMSELQIEIDEPDDAQRTANSRQQTTAGKWQTVVGKKGQFTLSSLPMSLAMWVLSV